MVLGMFIGDSVMYNLHIFNTVTSHLNACSDGTLQTMAASNNPADIASILALKYLRARCDSPMYVDLTSPECDELERSIAKWNSASTIARLRVLLIVDILTGAYTLAELSQT
jgi:hypothetical protein